MLLGLNHGAWLFWLLLVLAIICAGMTTWSLIVSAKSNAIVNGVGFVVTTVVATLIWTMQGECVLPQPNIIEFHQGMNLCPGQAAKINIKVPVPAPDQRI